MDNNGALENKKELPVSANGRVYLMYQYDAANNRHQFSYSTDGRNFHVLGDSYENGEGDWKGVRTGLYHYNVEADEEKYPCGTAMFDFFEYTTDGPSTVAVK